MFERGRATSSSTWGMPYGVRGTVPNVAATIACISGRGPRAGHRVRVRTEVTGIGGGYATVPGMKSPAASPSG